MARALVSSELLSYVTILVKIRDQDLCSTMEKLSGYSDLLDRMDCRPTPKTFQVWGRVGVGNLSLATLSRS